VDIVVARTPSAVVAPVIRHENEQGRQAVMIGEDRDFRASDGAAAELVVDHVRGQIERAEVKPGDRLPPERELAQRIGVSRPSVRAGLRSLSAMGVVQTRHGSGTYIADGPPQLDSRPLSLLAALHGFTTEQMFEARRVLEVGVAGLAAERASGEQIAAMAEEVTGMFASVEDQQAFLMHDIRFHRAVAMASGNPILASLVEMVSSLYFEHRRRTLPRGRDLRETAVIHRNIYHAVRAHDADRARREMSVHLPRSQRLSSTDARAAVAVVANFAR
jgi:GntR family transcriptional regulator, transcriptional repressor for pyruvate dehydrogenase complex